MRLTIGKFVVHLGTVLRRSLSVKPGRSKVKTSSRGTGSRRPAPQIAVPEDSCQKLASVISSHTRLRKLMSLLAKTGDKLEKQWSRRLKALREKFATGDLDNVAEVARDLYRRQQEKDLSMAERNLYQEAKDMLVAEVALVLDVDHEEAERTIDGAIDGVPLTRLGLDRGKDKK